MTPPEARRWVAGLLAQLDQAVHATRDLIAQADELLLQTGTRAAWDDVNGRLISFRHFTEHLLIGQLDRVDTLEAILRRLDQEQAKTA